MSRSAEDLLEFDKLRDLLRLRTTCAPGRRAVESLGFGRDRAVLESDFARIREAREWMRAGRELGFGSLADPEGWLAKIQGPGAVLESKELLNAASLLETAGWLREQFREDAAKFPLLAARAAAAADFRYSRRNPPLHSAERRNRRRRFARAAPYPRQHRPNTRLDPESPEAVAPRPPCRSR